MPLTLANVTNGVYSKNKGKRITMTPLTPRLLTLVARLYIPVFLAALLFFNPNATQAESMPEGCSVEVVLAITSGVPSPSWEIEDPQTLMRLANLFNNLDPNSSNSLELNFSAFGGYLIYTQGHTCGLPNYMEIKDGFVRFKNSEGDSRIYQDTTGMENFLNMEAHRRKVIDTYDPLEFIEF